MMKSAHKRAVYEFRLYTTGATPRSIRAVRNMVDFCRKNLTGRYRLRVVDLYDEPAEAALAQVVAAPTLLKLRPSPVRRMIGDMSDETQLRRALGLVETEP
jgi:circadian clock protein KaiB